MLRQAAAVLLLCAGASRAASLKHPWRVGPEEIRSEDPRTLAEALVARLHGKIDGLDKAVSGARAAGDGAEIVMMVPRQTLDSIKKYGFLNQHQTQTSGGFHRIADRFLAEQELAMARLPYDAAGKALLPKYALLVRDGEDWRRALPARYGDAVVVFKKEVRRRATWTYADSLDFDAQAGLVSLGGPANPVLPRTFLYKRNARDDNACRHYCEVQLWGPLDWGDVDHVEESSAPASAADAALAARHYEAGLSRARLPDSALIADGGVDATWELAARPKTPAVTAALEKAAGSPDAQTRAAALYGLGERPWPALKPFLLKGLSDGAWPVEALALALAAEHPDDADVKEGLRALKARLDLPPSGHRGPYEARLREWLERAGLP